MSREATPKHVEHQKLAFFLIRKRNKRTKCACVCVCLLHCTRMKRNEMNAIATAQACNRKQLSECPHANQNHGRIWSGGNRCNTLRFYVTLSQTSNTLPMWIDTQCLTKWFIDSSHYQEYSITLNRLFATFHYNFFVFLLFCLSNLTSLL